MSVSTDRPVAGSLRAQPGVSTFAFAVRHSGVFRFRGAVTDVVATLRADDDGLTLDGVATVESLSVVQPDALRASLLGPKFFDAARHPEIGFHSTEIRVDDDGTLQLAGELSMRGVTRPVTATGEYAAPRVVSYGEVAGMRLQTTIDRRAWGLEWQAPLPGGGDTVGWMVELDIDLLFLREDDEQGD
jgi:polyisoprenoid-binding protein YceI